MKRVGMLLVFAVGGPRGFGGIHGHLLLALHCLISFGTVHMISLPFWRQVD